jgi:hypothetical protein
MVAVAGTRIDQDRAVRVLGRHLVMIKYLDLTGSYFVCRGFG